MVVKIKPKTVLMVVAGAGMVITTILAVRKTPEAQKKKEEALQKKREETGDENAHLTFVESMQAQVGSYIPAIVSGLVTLGSLTGSEVLSEKNLKKATKALDDFKDMTEKIDGKGAVKTVEKALEQKKLDEKKHKPWDQPESFRIVFQGHSIQFEKSRSEVIEALYQTNRLFHGKGIVTFNEFLDFLDQPPVEEGDNRGWESYIGDALYGYTWIDFGLKECEDEWWVTEIYFPVYPHFFEQEMCEAEIEKGCRKLGIGGTGAAPEDG